LSTSIEHWPNRSSGPTRVVRYRSKPMGYFHHDALEICGSSKSTGDKKNEKLRGRCSWSGRGKDEAWRKLERIQDLTAHRPNE
jgi:hypothetical protein